MFMKIQHIPNMPLKYEDKERTQFQKEKLPLQMKQSPKFKWQSEDQLQLFLWTDFLTQHLFMLFIYTFQCNMAQLIH